MNANLKIALLLGYTFTRHGWINPGSDENHAFKVWDDDDYQMLNFTNAGQLVRVMMEIENTYGLQFEFCRAEGTHTLLKIHRLKPRMEDEMIKIQDPDFNTFIKRLLTEVPIKEDLELKVAEVKETYPWHFAALNELSNK